MSSFVQKRSQNLSEHFLRLRELCNGFSSSLICPKQELNAENYLSRLRLVFFDLKRNLNRPNGNFCLYFIDNEKKSKTQSSFINKILL